MNTAFWDNKGMIMTDLTLNFFVVGKLTCFHPYSAVLSPDKSDGPMSHPVLLFCQEKFLAGVASNRESQCKVANIDINLLL